MQSSLQSRGDVLLMQQPEVHLHPRAQAALGTFFTQVVTKSERTLVVETHSDYLVDRVMQEVAEGHLQASKVLVLFFDKRGLETTVYPIRITDSGDVIGAPPSYRQFFLQEELNLLNRTTRSPATQADGTSDRERGGTSPERPIACKGIYWSMADRSQQRRTGLYDHFGQGISRDKVARSKARLGLGRLREMKST